MNNDIKKIIATAIASGALVAGGFVATNREDCTYAVKYQDKEICFTAEEKEFIEQTVGVSKGFGGIQFYSNEK